MGTSTRLQEAHEALRATSRTFLIPISRLPAGLQEAVASAYLCLRAIDEIEDHESLPGEVKAKLLTGISKQLQAGVSGEELVPAMPALPEVTHRLPRWLALAPPDISPRIADATAAMADRMAAWALNHWRIRSRSDLDGYTFSVAGAVGLLLCDLWAWYDGTKTSRPQAVGFGKGLQATNIVLNRLADRKRGVDFYPPGWDDSDMREYAWDNLRLADAYTAALPDGPVQQFCAIPLALAWASLQAHAQGRPKLTRAEVERLAAASRSVL